MSAPEPPTSPPVWWTCENECWRCYLRHCPRRFEAGPEYYADTIDERDDYEPKRMKE